MELSDTDKPGFVLYCERHAPLEVKRAIESKRNSSIQEISKFCRNLERFYEMNKERCEPIPEEEKTAEITYYPKFKMVRNPENKDAVSLLFKSGVRSVDLQRDLQMEKLRRENRFIREVEHELNKFEEFGNVLKFKWECVNSDKNDGTLERRY